MYKKTILLAAATLSAGVDAAPTNPRIDASVPASVNTLSEYFNLLAEKIPQARSLASSCMPAGDSVAVLPLTGASGSLPPPSAGLMLKHVGVGRGTQNYTCDPTKPDAAPTSTGAVASLFNGTYLAAAFPDVLTSLTKAALLFNLSQADGTPGTPTQLAPSNLQLSGHHFFSDPTTPFFDLNVGTGPNQHYGSIPCQKVANVTAPAGAGRGQQNETAVPWLKLTAKPGASGGLSEVYRVETVGGSAPASCVGMPANFTRQYSALYWFYGTPNNSTTT